MMTGTMLTSADQHEGEYDLTAATTIGAHEVHADRRNHRRKDDAKGRVGEVLARQKEEGRHDGAVCGIMTAMRMTTKRSSRPQKENCASAYPATVANSAAPRPAETE